MNPASLKTIYERVLKLTEQKSIVWKAARETEAEYEANFSRSSLKIVRNVQAEGDSFVLEVYNEDGVVIGYVAPVALDEYDQAVVHLEMNVQPLYTTVEDQVYKFENTTKSLMEDLDKLNQNARLGILSAKYGAGDVTRDVTEILKRRIVNGTLRILVSNDTLGGDPCDGVGKQLEVMYSLSGTLLSKTVAEKETLVLP